MKNRLTLDCILLIIFLLCFSFRFFLEWVHYCLGGIFLLLILSHIHARPFWYSVFRRGTTTYKKISRAVTIFLFILLVVITFSGAVLAVFPNAIQEFRLIHTSTTYWFLVFLGVHMGLSWEQVKGQMRKKVKSSKIFLVSPLSNLVLLFLCLYGLWVYVDIGMNEKLLLEASFDYWPENRPLLFFFMHRAAVIFLFGLLTRIFFLFIKRIRKGT